MAAQRDWIEKDFYEVLGVGSDASQEEIKKAYRRLSRELHPDANPDDPSAEERFKAVSEAYAVLGNEEKRREYDEIRRLGGAGAFTGGFPGGPGGFTFRTEDVGDLGDLFSGLFGTGGGRGGGFSGGRGRRARKGQDVEARVTLSFEDSIVGVTTTLRVTGAGPCEACHGSGARRGTRPQTCATCGGSGTVAVDQGVFSLAETCPQCGGRGQTIDDPCPQCKGSGREVKPREIRVRIPAGVKDGARIRLAGRGGPGLDGGPPGDLYVRVSVEPHPLFGRRGDDVTLEVPLTFAEATLGTKLRVPLPLSNDGVAHTTIRIPPGTASGRTFRIAGEGAPRRGGSRGDLLVTVTVDVPRKLSKRQRQLVKELAELDDTAARDEMLTTT
jgi:molecular chaperone DnaJ